MHLPRWRRLVTGFLTADLSYAVFTTEFAQPAQDRPGQLAQEAFLAGNYFTIWASWIGSSLAGVALAHAIPSRWGLGFAGVLCLVGVLGTMATTTLRVLAGLVAAVAAVALYALPLKLNIVAAIAVAVLAGVWLEGRVPARLRERRAA
jgi:predicted branched-subunit amino acid permease